MMSSSAVSAKGVWLVMAHVRQCEEAGHALKQLNGPVAIMLELRLKCSDQG